MISIQRRLTGSLAVLCSLLWCAGSLAAYLAMRAELIGQFDLALKTSVEALTNMAERSEKEFKFDSVGELMPAFYRSERPDYFQLWLPDGSSLYRSPALEEDNLGDLPRSAGTLDLPRFWNLTLPDGFRGRAIGVRFVPKEDEDEPRSPGGTSLSGEVTLVAGFHRDDLDRKLHYLGLVLLTVGAAMAAATAFVVTVVVHRGLQPLSALAERASAIDAGSLQLRFPTDNVPAELSPIGQRLNDLLARLEASFARERRFSADAAHELRTPIAELRALAEVALKWPDDVGASERALKDALGIALQMESIATGLLALAHCENGSFTAHPERVCIASLVREVSQPLGARVREKQIELAVDVPKDVCWFTDLTALRSILTNLLSNAFEHSRADSYVRVRVESTDRGERLLISNPTDNLAPEDLPHLFERFWRKDAARLATGHFGLGLALAHAQAQSLGMKLCAGLTISGEISFTLSGAILCREAAS